MEKIKSGLTSFKNKGISSSVFSRQETKEIDLREYRPLDVTVSATLHDIRGHLLKVIQLLLMWSAPCLLLFLS